MSAYAKVEGQPIDGQGEPLYFGCWRRLGHHFYTRSGLKAGSYGEVQDALPFGPVDGRLQPSAKQGEAAIHHADGWTALAFSDYTVDARPGSNSVFFLPGTLTFAEAVKAATEAFPTVMARLPAPLTDSAEVAA